MAIIKNGLSMMMRGKVGAFSYYVSETRQIVRQAQNNSNFGSTATRSPQQQSRRVMWANLVNFYSGNKAWMKKAFEDLKPGVSVFNRFMQLNLPNAYVALTKAQAATKMWVLAPYTVSQGSLPRPYSGVWTAQYSTNISVTEAPESNATVAQVSQAILENNSDFLNGDAIVAVKFMGTSSPLSAWNGNPKLANFSYFEFVLNINDNRSFTEAYPDWGFSQHMELRNTQLEDVEGYTYIHTRKRDGKLLVSTSNILMNEGYIEDSQSWGSSSQVTAAAESYKVEDPVMLMPGGETRGNGATAGGGSTPGGGGGDDDGNLGE